MRLKSAQGSLAAATVDNHELAHVNRRFKPFTAFLELVEFVFNCIDLIDLPRCQTRR
jgi:hypothetical protein